MNIKITKKLLFFIKPYIWYLVFAVISSAVGVGLSLIIPVYVGNAIDCIIGKNNVDFYGVFVILEKLLYLIVASAVFNWLSSYCTASLSFKTTKDIRIAVFNKLNVVPLRFIDRTPHGDVISRVVNDIEFISDGLLQGFTQLFSGVVTIIGTVFFMLSINVKISVMVILVTPLSLFVAAFIAKGCHRMFTKQSVIMGQLTAYSSECINNINVLKTFGYEDEANEAFKSINNELNTVGVKAQFYSALTNPCTRFVNNIVYALTGIVGAVFAVKGGLSIGQISCFLTYANQYTKPFNEISGVIAQLQSAFASAKRVFDILDEEELSKEGTEEIKEFNGEVEFKNVYFSYTKERELIKNFNLSVKKGQKVAIVGHTGCGKTTLINLLMRFYDINSGEIYVSGKNVLDVTRNSLRSGFGMVLQDTWLFSGTIRDNIAYGKSNATQKEVEDAAKAAYIHNFIMRLPHGYDTLVGENGGSISQGQKQLLCIARIMLTKPDMLILDEATSSIDTMTEIRIQKAFEKIMIGRTSFIVAHRLSTIKEADIILYMENGNVVEQGTHNQLIKKKGRYFDLYNSQFAFQED